MRSEDVAKRKLLVTDPKSVYPTLRRFFCIKKKKKKKKKKKLKDSYPCNLTLAVELVGYDIPPAWNDHGHQLKEKTFCPWMDLPHQQVKKTGRL